MPSAASRPIFRVRPVGHVSRASRIWGVSGARRVAVIGLAGFLAASSTPARADEDSLHRLAAVVDYVAADYAGAVRDGQVLDSREYEEQRGLARDAGELAVEVGRDRNAGANAHPKVTEASRAALQAEVSALVLALDRKAPLVEVAAAARAVRTRLLGDFGLVLVPPAPPSESRARELYPKNCAPCHGADGRAITDRARELHPAPVSFFDAERMPRISPSLAFHALTFGVKNTGMASFDTLSAADRWSLAFYVTGMRHAGHTAAAERALRAAGSPPTPDLAHLALLSDDELDSLLLPSLPDPAARASVLSSLRHDKPFLTPAGHVYAVCRRLLGEAAAAAAAGDRSRAHALAVSAYLDGFESHEAALRARDAHLASRAEASFLDLRHAIDGGENAAQVARRVAAINVLLDGAEERPINASVAFVAAMTIALREGLEAALLIAALLAFLRKSGRPDRAGVVHAGWLAAIPAGLIAWYVAGSLVAGAHRELMEAVLTLFAAAMIISVSHWFFGKQEAMHWVGFLRRKVSDLAPSDSAWPLFSLAFIAAFREALEIVLFYRALLLDAVDDSASVALGAAVGAVSILGLVAILGRLGRKLNPRPVMLASSILLAALSVALVGRGIRSLQEGAYLDISPVAVPDLSVIGIYPSREGLLAQLLVLLIIVAPSLLARLRNPPAPPAAA